MQQWQLSRAGAGVAGLHRRTGIPIPTPAAAQIVVKMKALSINFRDCMIASIKNFAGTLDNVVPLSDGAGEVTAVGPECSRFKVGDRVALTFSLNNVESDQMEGPGLIPSRGGSRHGVAAQYVLSDEIDAVRIPDYMTYEEAAALPCAAVTGWHGMNSGPKRLVPGSVVLVQGTGGVSSLAAQLAHAAGCRVIALSSSEAKMKELLHLGVVRPGDWVNYRENPKWGEAVLALTPQKRGVDVVVDVVGMSSINESLIACRRRGTISIIGLLDQKAPPEGFRLDLVLMKRLHIVGNNARPRVDFEDMLQLMDAQQVHPIIDPKHFAFADLPAAYEYLQSQKHSGKVIIKVE